MHLLDLLPRPSSVLAPTVEGSRHVDPLDTTSVPVKDEPAVPSKTDSSPKRGPTWIFQPACVRRQPRSGLSSAHPSQGGNPALLQAAARILCRHRSARKKYVHA